MRFAQLALLLPLVAFAVPLQTDQNGDSSMIHTAEANSDLITDLPGLTDGNITQYSGLLQLPGTQKHLFYWYIEAETDPETRPLVFWTNGGPGCSGLIGFFTEHGPFRPNATGHMTLNPYSWHKLANMIYMEQPAGVGFSYSDNAEDYVIGDRQAAIDHYAAIKQFLNRFPKLASNKLYISSESYGGHYMPNLAREFIRNKADNLNFKGFMLGNPLTDMIENAKGNYGTLFGHQIVSQPLFENWYKNCSNGQDTEDCQDVERKMSAQAGSLNPYAIDYPVCNNEILKSTIAQRIWLLNHIHAAKPHVRSSLGLIPPSDYQPCETDYVTKYLNRPDVQKALHVRTTEWAACSTVIQYSSDDVQTPMQSVYSYLLASGVKLQILIFSGDDDTVCGTIGTQSWLWTFGRRTVKDWTNWNYEDPEYGVQTGGFLVKFDGLSFATVHGAGHEVPAYRPVPALKLFEMYLNGDVF